MPAAATPPSTTGYSATTITGDLQRYATEMQRCYDQFRPAHRPHIGRIRVRFALAGDGAVESAVVAHDGLHAPRATACISRAASAWRFPAPPAEHAQLEYTFLFR
ncbi:MAG: AgmX/PglI C-terminal domain-containing protein [Myxococcales bacterium]|nr:AgmX/PglI C-terminal domain-containing protein [Myxococcales bacterium]